MLSQDDQSKDHQPSGTCQELITVLAAHRFFYCVTSNKITPHIYSLATYLNLKILYLHMYIQVAPNQT